MSRPLALAAAAAAATLLACDSRKAERHPNAADLPDRRERTTLSSSSTAREPEPPPVPVVADLVADGTHWRIKTARNGPIHVWIPRGYRARGATTIIYVHGYYTYVDGAWEQMQLPLQFASSTLNAMFIACEAPSGGHEAVFWRSLPALLDAVDAGIGQPAPRRRVVAIAHSGGYRTILEWLGADELDTVVLLDAAYGEIDQYRNWVLASPRHRLINVGDYSTRKWTEPLHKSLPTSVILDDFPSLEDGIPEEAAKARILYIRSKLGHFPIVTGGIALPMILRTLRARRVLDTPLTELIEPKP